MNRLLASLPTPPLSEERRRGRGLRGSAYPAPGPPVIDSNWSLHYEVARLIFCKNEKFLSILCLRVSLQHVRQENLKFTVFPFYSTHGSQRSWRDLCKKVQVRMVLFGGYQGPLELRTLSSLAQRRRKTDLIILNFVLGKHHTIERVLLPLPTWHFADMFDRWLEDQRNHSKSPWLDRVLHSLILTDIKMLMYRFEVKSSLNCADFTQYFRDEGVPHLSVCVMEAMHPEALHIAEMVCHNWRELIHRGDIFRTMVLKQINESMLWRTLAFRKNWIKLFNGVGAAQTDFSSLHLYGAGREAETRRNWEEHRCLLHGQRKEVGRLSGIYCVQADHRFLYIGRQSGKIQKLCIRDLRPMRVFDGHRGPVLTLQYDREKLISGSVDRSVRIWDMATGEKVNQLNAHCAPVMHLRYHGQTLVTGCEKGRVIVWTIKSMTNIQRHTVLNGHQSSVNAVALNGRHLVTGGGNGIIQMWSTEPLALRYRRRAHRGGIASLALNGNLLVSGSADTTIRLWDMRHGHWVRVLYGHYSMVRSLGINKHVLVSGGADGRLMIWDLDILIKNRKEERDAVMGCIVRHSTRITSIYVDDHKIVTTSLEDQLNVWDFLYDAEDVRALHRISDTSEKISDLIEDWVF